MNWYQGLSCFWKETRVAHHFCEKTIFPSRGRKRSVNMSQLSAACSSPWSTTCSLLILLQELQTNALSGLDPRFLSLSRLPGSDHSCSGNYGLLFNVSSRFYILLNVLVSLNSARTWSSIKSFSHLSNLNLTRNGNIFFIQMSPAVTFPQILMLCSIFL
jgi:hypothetical protein